ncbi:TPA: hypothetical protein ACH3X3_001278 [Trebouxia sp. C0006]
MAAQELLLLNGLSGAVPSSEAPQGRSGSLHQQLQLLFASPGLTGQQGWSPAFSNAKADLPGLQGCSPDLSMLMDSRAHRPNHMLV